MPPQSSHPSHDCSRSFDAVLVPFGIGQELSTADLRILSPLALAYIGDAVYELFVRGQLLMPPKPVRTYHGQVVAHVRAERQAEYLDRLRPDLNDAELDVVRRGRNAASSRRPRASLRDHQQATAFEALIGYLYLTDSQRLSVLLGSLPIDTDIPNSDS